MLHTWEYVFAPLHDRPTGVGAGLLHDLERLRLPPPHVTGHADHPAQVPHFPSTFEIDNI